MAILNSKKMKKLRKQVRAKRSKPASDTYLEQIKRYDLLFKDFPQITFLTHNILESDHLISQGLLPQSLPLLQIPDTFQDELFQSILKDYPMGNPKGDELWNRYSQALPKLDKLLRSYRDHLEAHYGMWAYISAPFIKDLAKFLNGAPTLEVMAGNGYISAGLRNHGQNIIATDSMGWITENETGKHTLTEIEPLDALDAWHRYHDKVKYVMMSWSPDGIPVDWQLLQEMRKTNPDVKLICIGEKLGSSGSKTFWSHATYVDPEATEELNKHFSHFDLVHDQLYIVQ